MPLAERRTRSSGLTSSDTWARHAIAGLLIGVFLLQVFQSIEGMSTVTDESVDIAAGYSYWATRDARINLEHPVLIKLLLATSSAPTPRGPDAGPFVARWV
jgi:hypothetical protein